MHLNTLTYSEGLPLADKVDLALAYFYQYHKEGFVVLRSDLRSAQGWKDHDALEVHDLLVREGLVEENPVHGQKYSVRLSEPGLDVCRNGGYNAYLFREKRDKENEKKDKENIRINNANQAKISQAQRWLVYALAVASFITLLLAIIKFLKDV